MSDRPRLAALIASGIVLAAGSGYLTSQALSAGALAPTTTTTVNLGTGERGPPGPPGPQGPAGEPADCGAGFELGLLVINHPGGQTTIKTCLKQ